MFLVSLLSLQGPDSAWKRLCDFPGISVTARQSKLSLNTDAPLILGCLSRRFSSYRLSVFDFYLLLFRLDAR